MLSSLPFLYEVVALASPSKVFLTSLALCKSEAICRKVGTSRFLTSRNFVLRPWMFICLTSSITLISLVFMPSKLHWLAKSLFLAKNWITVYRISSINAPGLYFSKCVFGCGSIDICPAWGCNQDGALLIRSYFGCVYFLRLDREQ